MNRDSSSARWAVAVTPNDDAPLAARCRGLWVGTTGDLAVKFGANDTAVVLKSVPVGVHPFSVTYVMATGTTADDIIALY